MLYFAECCYQRKHSDAYLYCLGNRDSELVTTEGVTVVQQSQSLEPAFFHAQYSRDSALFPVRNGAVTLQ